jgi:hypothetical protein
MAQEAEAREIAKISAEISNEAAKKAKKYAQHLIATRLLTRKRENDGRIVFMKYLNTEAERLARNAERTKQNIPKARLRNWFKTNTSEPLILNNDPPLRNKMENAMLAKKSRKNRRRRTRKIL